MNRTNDKEYANALMVDFYDKHTSICGKTLLSSSYAVFVMNLNSDDISRIFEMSSDVIKFYYEFAVKKDYDESKFDNVCKKVLEIDKEIKTLLPFTLISPDAHNKYMDMLLTETGVLQSKRYLSSIVLNILNMLEPESERVYLSQDLLDERKEDGFVYKSICELLYFYGHFARECYNFWMATRGFAIHLSKKKFTKNPSNLAKEVDLYFNDSNVQKQLNEHNPIKGFDWFRPMSSCVTEYVTAKHLMQKNKTVIAKRQYYHSFMDFLVADFYAGIKNGHYPKECRVCGRYFLAKDARNQLYCDGYDPNDEKGRTCRKVGQDRKRLDRLKEENLSNPIKRICTTRLSTIRKHLEREAITLETAEKAKKYVQKLRDRALRNHEYYFCGDYEKDTKTNTVYKAIK